MKMQQKQAMRAVVSLAVMITACSTSPRRAIANDEATWKNGSQIEGAIEQARSERKPLLLHFSADWCGPCQKLKRHVFAKPEFLQESSKFILVEIDVDAYPEVAEHCGVTALPYDVFLRSDTTPLVAQASPTNVTAYTALLRKVREEAREPSELAQAPASDVPKIQQPIAR